VQEMRVLKMAIEEILKDRKKFFLAVSAVLLVLLSLGYLFVPREKLGDRSPLSVLAAPDKRQLFECVGPKPLDYKQSEASSDPVTRAFARTLGISEFMEANSSKTGCLKYSGVWQKKKTVTGSQAKSGVGWSDVGELISKDLPAIGGLFLLIGASPALGFFIFQSVVTKRATGTGTTSMTLDLPVAPQIRPQTPSALKSDISERLQKLQSLHEQGLITEDELATRRKQMLDEI